ncbi:hypothetical protein [Planctomicrobium sp. SH664]|uniref:hypothetical protein n=1 Tax=Planctomicrobium sp. SH664 TaxID=3448125 RepID=UPI003F5BD9A0
MRSHRSSLRIALSLAGVLLTGTTGCQSLRSVRPTAAESEPQAALPPLSSVAGGQGMLAPGIPQLAPLPSQVAFIPPQPEAIQTVAYEPPPAPPVTPVPQPLILQPSVGNGGAKPQSDPCLPGMQQWRDEVSRQTELLTQRLAELEKELTQTRQALQTVSGELQTANAEIARLNGEVTRSQQQVRQLETTFQSQQQADLEALTELNETLHKLLRQQQAGRGGTPR